MARVAALYRFPVKSLAPESVATLSIGDDGRVGGDRVLGFRYANTAESDDDWSDKHSMLALVNTPGLARLTARLESGQHLAVDLDGQTLVADRLDRAGRVRICAAVGEFVVSLPVSGLRDRPDRLPLRLVGDGVTPRHHDDPDPTVTLHGRASLQALRDRIGDPDLDEVRFRSNIVIEGVDAWAELGWAGGRLRLGALTAAVGSGCARCLATHVNPATGERDRSVMKTLVKGFGQPEPTFAVALEFSGAGRLEVGDPVELLAGDG